MPYRWQSALVPKEDFFIQSTDIYQGPAHSAWHRLHAMDAGENWQPKEALNKWLHKQGSKRSCVPLWTLGKTWEG